MPVAKSCPYYSQKEEMCVNCLHGAFTECARYRRELAYRRVACLGKFSYEPTGFDVDAHRRVKVVWGTDSTLLKRWILEDSVVGRFRVVHMDMVEVKTLVLDEEGSYDDRIDGLGVSINNGGGIYLDLRGVVHSDVYDRGNTMFSILRDFVFLCVTRGVHVYIDCNGEAVNLFSEGAREISVGQNVFMAEFMAGGVGYRLIEGDGHSLLVETPESRYLRGGISGKTVLLGIVPWRKWLVGKGRCRFAVGNGGVLTEEERKLMLTEVCENYGDTIVGSSSSVSANIKKYTEDVKRPSTDTPKESVQGTGATAPTTEREFIEMMREKMAAKRRGAPSKSGKMSENKH